MSDIFLPHVTKPGEDTNPRPQRIVILNIMPVKHTTETHLMRLLSNTPLQIEIDLIHPKNHTSKNTPIEHLETFYKTKNKCFLRSDK